MGNTILIQRKGKNDTEFDMILWVLKARSFDELHKPLLGIYISDDNWAVCTDSHRLHMHRLENHIQAPGLYLLPKKGGINKDVIVLTKDETGLEFPDYKRVIPTATPDKWVSYFAGKDATNSYFTYLTYQIACYEKKYIEDVFMHGVCFEIRGYIKNREHHPMLEIVIQHTEQNQETKKEETVIVGRAIVMPLAEGNIDWKYPEPEVAEPAYNYIHTMQTYEPLRASV